MIRTSAVLLSMVALLAACTSNSGTQLPDADFFVNAGQSFGLRVGDTAGVVTTNAIVLVRFNFVFGDTRCPQDVNCVQAGFATATFSVQTALDLHDVTFEVPPQGQLQQEVAEVTIDFLELRPPAQDGVTIDPLSYIAGIRVRETGSILSP